MVAKNPTKTSSSHPKAISNHSATLPTIISNSADSRVGSAHSIVTLSSSNLKQEQAHKLQNCVRTTSPYINFYDIHATEANTSSPATNRLANMYKSNLTNNYNSNSLFYQNEAKKHVHFYESPYKFPTKHFSVIKGVKVRSDLVGPSIGGTVETKPLVSGSTLNYAKSTRNSGVHIDENLKSDEDSDSYYYTTVSSNYTKVVRDSTADTLAKSAKLDDKATNHVADESASSPSGIKKSILTKKKHRYPITSNLPQKSAHQAQKRVTFAT